MRESDVFKFNISCQLVGVSKNTRSEVGVPSGIILGGLIDVFDTGVRGKIFCKGWRASIFQESSKAQV